LNVPDTDWPLAVVGAGFAPWSEGLAIVVIFGAVLTLYRWAARLGAGTQVGAGA
jgi:hypothetical protein